MKLSNAGAKFIHKWEGFRAQAYRDVGGVWTIGYGHTGTDVYAGKTITREEADKLFRNDVARAENAVRKYITVPLAQHQFDALVSFTYNLGAGALQRSTLRRKINDGEYSAVPSELMKWVYVGRQRVQGLINRRTDEGKLWRGEHYKGNTPITPTVPPEGSLNERIKAQVKVIIDAATEIIRLLG